MTTRKSEAETLALLNQGAFLIKRQEGEPKRTNSKIFKGYRRVSKTRLILADGTLAEGVWNSPRIRLTRAGKLEETVLPNGDIIYKLKSR